MRRICAVSLEQDGTPDPDPLDEQPLACLVGPTASGKTALALELAEQTGAEIVSLDSMLVYRGMDIGTAKPEPAERARVPHHLIDLVDPPERYDVQRYLRDARAALREIHGRGRRAIFVGGTGFYLAALLRGLFEGPPVDAELRARLVARVQEQGADAVHAELAERDPLSAQRIHANDTKRVVRALEVLEQTGRPLSDWQSEWRSEPGEREARARVIGLGLETPVLDQRIAARTQVMFDAGWREEALRIRDGAGFGPTSIQALGYSEVLQWADGELARAAAAERIALRTRQFARRQRTWYRKFRITWFDAGAADAPAARRALEL